ncbi:MAG: GNAT family N-acetyltransferase [Chlamydiota bacterium]
MLHSSNNYSVVDPSMKKTHPKKFALIGPPGSGKSTFASKLGKILKIPVHHLDKHMFESGGKKRDKQEFIGIQKALLNEEAWIVEGCSSATFEMRVSKADVFIYLQLSRILCIWRLLKRVFNYKKDLSGLRIITWEILRYTWNFNKKKNGHIMELGKKYPETEFLIFNNQKDADFFLESQSQHMNEKISIRNYQSEDVQALAEIYYNTIHRVNIQHYTEEQVNAWAPPSSLETKGWAKKFLKLKPIVATVLEKIVGFAEFEPNGHIDCFYCHDEWIGKGVGSALMKEILQRAKNNHIHLIFAEVSITAKPFFEKWGFRVVTE